MYSLLLLGLQALWTATVILLTWVIWFAIFAGWGNLWWRLQGGMRLDTRRILMSFWLGFTGVVLFLQFWHLALPVNALALVIVVLAGAIGLFWNAHAIVSWWRGVNFREDTAALIAVLGASLWLANRASGPCTSFDSGMYHIPWVKWITSYAVVPGLGNLHDRLAFNSSSLLYASLLDVGPWHGRVTHVANGLLLFVLLLQICVAIVRLWRCGGPARTQDAFDLFLLGPLTLFAFSLNIASLSTDVAPVLVCLVATSSWLAWLNLPIEERLAEFHTPAFVLILLGLAVCLKLSTIGFAAAGMLAVLWTLARQGQQWRAAQQIRWGAAIVLLLAITHAALGVALSGYPLYPSTLLGVPTAWQVPKALADAERDWMTIFSRRSALPGLAWLPEFWRANSYWWYSHLFYCGVVLPLLASFLWLVTGAVLFRNQVSRSHLRRETSLLLPALLVGILLWFVVTPDARFGVHLFWMVAALSFVWLVHRMRSDVRSVRSFAAVALAIGFLPAIAPAVRTAVRKGFSAPGISRELFVAPGPDHGLHPLPVATLFTYTTKSGLALRVPVKDNCCWYAELPCTPHPAPNLVRKEGLDGRPMFVTDGEWQQINWPNHGDELVRQWRERQAGAGK